MYEADFGDRAGRRRAISVLAACGMAWSLPAGVLGQDDPFPSVLDLMELDGSTGFRLEGAGSESFFGSSLGSAGDLNGDGFEDLAVGAPFGGGFRGGVYIFFGGESFPAVVDASTLNGEDGLRIDGANPGDAAGRSVAGRGDVNGDGVDDVLIGADRADPDGMRDAGEAYVVFGRDVSVVGPFAAVFGLADLDELTGVRFKGEGSSSYLGTDIGYAGDLDSDGYVDLICGASQYSSPGSSFVGAAYVFYGRDPSSDPFPPTVDVGDLTPADGARIAGDEADERAGTSLVAVCDVNDDGLKDFMVGAPRRTYGAGISYVVFGVADRTSVLDEFGDLDGTNGFKVVPPAGTYGNSGQAVASLGDINGDGVDDFAIGAPLENVGGRYSAGVTRVVFGRDDGFPPELDLGDLDGTNGFTIEGDLEFGASGRSLAAGDINGDGINDIAISAPYAEGELGQVYVLFGDDTPPPPVVQLSDIDGTNGFVIVGSDTSRDRIGFALEFVGDLNGDGLEDLAVGTYPSPGYGEERAFVVFGRQLGGAPCAADLDGDGALTIFDFLEFQNLFDIMDPRADFDGDGSFTIFDFLAFQNAFSAGCP
ncbi:MAG: GC-type dockerin domain-anchored protein [Planctomycetota bacterium]